MTARLGRLGRCLAALCMAGLLSGTVQALEGQAIIDALARAEPLEAPWQDAAPESHQGRFLLGWLLHAGRHAFPKDPARAEDLLQTAAEEGSVAAAAYCLERGCIDFNTRVTEALEAAARAGSGRARYLLYRRAREHSRTAPQQLDAWLLEAARLGYPRAQGELYVPYFLQWASRPRTDAEVRRKLERCRGEGLIYCYFLSGAQARKAGNHARALMFFEMLRWLDPGLFARYLDEARLADLARRLPQPARDLIAGRAAQRLARMPPTGNPRVDRFPHVCSSKPALPCVRRLALRDDQCLPPALESHPDFAGFRRSPGYLACLRKDWPGLANRARPQ